MFPQLIHQLSQIPQIEAIALGGSRATDRFDEASDYDVYLYCTAPVPEELRRDILSGYCSYMELGNTFWETEDNCTLNNGIDMDILYRDLDGFCQGIADVVENFQAHNGYTTCMWHNLLTCKILYDRDGRLAALKQRFSVAYPPQLRKNIIQRNGKLLFDHMPSYDSQIRKAVLRRDLVSINHRVSAFLESYFDILFALNGKTHPGEKRLISLCRQTCPVLPGRFEENLEALLQHMFHEPEQLEGDLEQIRAELSKIL